MRSRVFQVDAEWADYLRKNRRANEEAEWSPLTHRNVSGPCVRCRQRTAKTKRGVCRVCTLEENR